MRACILTRVCVSHQCLFGFLFICLRTAAAATPLLSLLLLSNKVSSLLCFQRKKETAAVATERVETGAQNITQHKTRTDRFIASEPIKTKFPKSVGLCAAFISTSVGTSAHYRHIIFVLARLIENCRTIQCLPLHWRCDCVRVFLALSKCRPAFCQFDHIDFSLTHPGVVFRLMNVFCQKGQVSNLGVTVKTNGFLF